MDNAPADLNVKMDAASVNSMHAVMAPVPVGFHVVTAAAWTQAPTTPTAGLRFPTVDLLTPMADPMADPTVDLLTPTAGLRFPTVDLLTLTVGLRFLMGVLRPMVAQRPTAARRRMAVQLVRMTALLADAGVQAPLTTNYAATTTLIRAGSGGRRRAVPRRKPVAAWVRVVRPWTILSPVERWLISKRLAPTWNLVP